MLRTHTCGELNKSNANKEVTLSGWVDSMRLSGKIGFLILRDRHGKTQCFLGKDIIAEHGEIRRETVVQIVGTVKERPDNQKRDEATGEIEVSVSNLKILSDCEPLPLEIGDENVTEETRLTYRYLDLRSEFMQKNIVLRHRIAKATRDFMDKNGFLEIETPFLAKSTPEGARDYLVPSRIKKGGFYALPQSPQLFKQLLMVSGMDRYFQIVKCFRDEDLRADRQPEFTQIDVELSFLEEEDIYNLFEGLMKHIFKEVLDVDLKIPFPRISYDEAMKKYGRDNPDVRKKGEDFAFTWVNKFPLFEFSDTAKRLVSVHHPFTMPDEESLKLLETKPEDAKSIAYDLVLNGSEIGGGSVRIHKEDIQRKVFKALKLTDVEAEEKFGFLLNAFKYGAPPHGGIAFGLDRLVAIMAGCESIRDVIAFPKNKNAEDMMLDAPGLVDKEQLDELHVNIKK